jgi:hypothetical protein
MVKSINLRRICVIAIMLVCGCRSASTTSSTGINRVPYGVNRPAYTRSYGSPQQPYDDDPSMPSQDPQPDPPSIVPAPGYAEPEDTPPVPSAKKSRWNLVPSGLKFPSMSRSNNDIHQTGINSDRSLSKKTVKPNLSSAMTEQTVTSRYSDTANRTSLPPAPNSDDPIIPPPTFTEANGETSPSGNSMTPRYGLNSRTANSNRGFRRVQTPELDGIARPLTIQNQTAASAARTDADTPLLLPPGK